MFRFTIRDVLWLMVVVGMGCAWWLDDARKYAAYRELYGGNGSVRSHFIDLMKRARSDPDLKADAEELTANALRQVREDVATKNGSLGQIQEAKSESRCFAAARAVTL